MLVIEVYFEKQVQRQFGNLIKEKLIPWEGQASHKTQAVKYPAYNATNAVISQFWEETINVLQPFYIEGKVVNLKDL